ncbi:hypothetical protein EHF33_20630 (plasmid) [Deinococcus psychrotolerans]|uniref:Uncharacterized protein n=1 Tax=Deinococcus psychrotolerans TaxID=2489213 RepID=A0A3G8YJ74_9DEIO|nr:hypothetical protein [Deinococcus psychrotolerans]AZI45318.1 hypothetical protein EHF33_20630 [Deinococcus psychrotolerans]
MWQQPDASPQRERVNLTDYQRALLRTLSANGWVRWVSWGQGYVLTGLGEVRLDGYYERYGPAATLRAPRPPGNQ